ncbi:MAG: CDP-alcohol phosphatidyltransferase family protein, partial [Chlorobi bacterium CHB2]|nr:CDP-alcohol phosphatidyltransferase family protein [Chlorobi bacterium CHB2]
MPAKVRRRRRKGGVAVGTKWKRSRPARGRRAVSFVNLPAMNANTAPPPPLNLRWTLSNGLSALRMLLVVPTWFTLASGMRLATVALFILSALTDVLDGWLARKRNEVSDLGKILDPLADKVYVGVVVVVMLLQGMLPLWFVLVVLGRDLLILVGGILFERRTGVVLPSNYPGKIAVLVLSA